MCVLTRHLVYPRKVLLSKYRKTSGSGFIVMVCVYYINLPCFSLLQNGFVKGHRRTPSDTALNLHSQHHHKYGRVLESPNSYTYTYKQAHFSPCVQNPFRCNFNNRVICLNLKPMLQFVCPLTF